MHEAAPWIWMQQVLGVGTRRVHDALARCGSPQELITRAATDLSALPFLDGEKRRHAVLRPDFSAAERLCEQYARIGATPLTYADPRYPDCLRQIHSPPLVLWAQGNLELLGQRYRIGMVGSREPDEYGLKAARKLSSEIAALGGVVLSGLARGIDVACHRGALEAGGDTIALVAGGLDLDYPKGNREVRKLIEQTGLVLSEYPLGAEAYPGNFPVRNRLISGLSLAVVLVQSRRQSGSMLTVAHALSQDRDVFALPGDVFSPLMEGCNMLLAEGAAPALSGWDILSRYEALYGYPLRLSEALPVAGQSKEAPERAPAPFVPPVHLDERQATVLTVLHEANAPCDADSLCARTAFPPACLLGVLTQLELFGLIEVQPGGAYRATDRILTKHGV